MLIRLGNLLARLGNFLGYRLWFFGNLYLAILGKCFGVLGLEGKYVKGWGSYVIRTGGLCGLEFKGDVITGWGVIWGLGVAVFGWREVGVWSAREKTIYKKKSAELLVT